MSPADKNDHQLVEEKARFIFFLKRWGGQLLIDETENDTSAVELDRRVLDYYLDQYNELVEPDWELFRQKKQSMSLHSLPTHKLPSIQG
jgi:hypothetical protein